MELAIVGLDGLSENMISHCQDELPVLNDIMTEGAGGTLWSTTPPVTLPAWTTFWTGKNPGRHGLYNMTSIDENYEISSAEINRSEGGIHDMLDDSVFVNLPATFPREPAGNSLLVRGSPPSPEAAMPDEIKDWKEADNYRTDHNSDLQSDPEAFLGDLKEIAEARFDLTRRAIEERDPQLGFVLFSSTDWLFHYLGSRADESLTTELMKDIDEYLGWFREEADTLLIMSDHGFEAKETAAYPNKILENEGLLSTEPPEDTTTSARFAVRAIQQFTKRSNLMHELVRRVYNRLIHTQVASELYEAKEEDIEYASTVAWHDGWGVVYLNDEYFAETTVPEESYEETRQRVIDALDGATHPSAGKELFESVLRGDDVYEGDAGVVPDIIIVPARGVQLYQSPMQDRIASSTNIYNHRPEGIIYGVGELVTDQEFEAEIVDMAPTVLHALGEAVPKDMDGEIIDDLLATNREPEMREPIGPGASEERTAEDEEEIREQLADLGYLE